MPIKRLAAVAMVAFAGAAVPIASSSPEQPPKSWIPEPKAKPKDGVAIIDPPASSERPPTGSSGTDAAAVAGRCAASAAQPREAPEGVPAVLIRRLTSHSATITCAAILPEDAKPGYLPQLIRAYQLNRAKSYAEALRHADAAVHLACTPRERAAAQDERRSAFKGLGDPTGEAAAARARAEVGCGE